MQIKQLQMMESGDQKILCEPKKLMLEFSLYTLERTIGIKSSKKPLRIRPPPPNLPLGKARNVHQPTRPRPKGVGPGSPSRSGEVASSPHRGLGGCLR